jgi:Ser/Thr protein kinase RdoA (MazF antagonist)
MSVESEIHDDSPFWSMIHGDAGPQNLLIGVERGILIDFEFGVYRNGLCDVVGARLGFPQTSSAMGVPEDDAERLETAYRRAVAPGIPEAEVDDIFFRGLSAAAAHWALNRWAASWRHHLRPALDSGQDDLDVAALGSALLVWDGFTGLAATTARFPSLAGTVASYASELVRRWPGLEKPGTYPALRNS